MSTLGIKIAFSITLITLGVIFLGCKKEKDNISGHIIFLHLGSERFPSEICIITVNQDSSYVKHKYNDGPLSYSKEIGHYLRKFGRSKANDVPPEIYKEIKDALLLKPVQISDLGKPDWGTRGDLGVFISDTVDSCQIYFPKDSLSKVCLEEIIEIAKKNKLERIYHTFEYFKDLQE